MKIYPHDRKELIYLLKKEWNRYPDLSFSDLVRQIILRSSKTTSLEDLDDFEILRILRKGIALTRNKKRE